MERRALLQVLRDGATHQRRRQAPALLLPAHAAPSSSSSSSSPRRHVHSSAALRSSSNSNAEGYQNTSSGGGARNIPDLAALASGQSQAPGPRVREKPSPSTYYTTRPTYVATLLELAELARQSKRALEQACILKPSMSPPTAADVAAVLSSSASSSSAAAAAAAALANSGSSGPTWLAPEHMAPHLGIATLKTSQYRRAVAALSLLARYRPLLRVHLTHLDPTLVTRVEQALDTFARRTGTQALSRDGIVTSPTEALRLARLAEQRKQGGAEVSPEEQELDVFSKKSQLDAHGRAYAFGRRKEASARVWIIPTAPATGGSGGDGEATIGRVLINNVPLGQAVSRTDHREQITWPLRLAGKLGLFNVFALVRGGGVSGQAGAVAHALAKALLVAAQNGLVAGGPEEVERIRSVLRKDGVLQRDPRMVERKKTGRLKARKAFTWVKR